jgi:hypothetical protein
MRLGGGVEVEVEREGQDLAQGRMQQTASPDDGIASVQAFQ